MKYVTRYRSPAARKRFAAKRFAYGMIAPEDGYR